MKSLRATYYLLNYFKLISCKRVYLLIYHNIYFNIYQILSRTINFVNINDKLININAFQLFYINTANKKNLNGTQKQIAFKIFLIFQLQLYSIPIHSITYSHPLNRYSAPSFHSKYFKHYFTKPPIFFISDQTLCQFVVLF